MTCQVTSIDRVTQNLLETARLAEHKEWEAHNPGKTKTNRITAEINRKFWTPGLIWECPWYFDPDNVGLAKRRESALRAIENGTFNKDGMAYLNRFYWTDWSHIRPPIMVVCPNGSQWCPDTTSMNGEGWRVSGVEPGRYENITCSPSIVVEGYHGFLQNGKFTADLDSPHPNGTWWNGEPA